tara:strand:- start:163 stop:690 length:528 start_codon:yes stop_codon:yes gene_type:complete
MKKFYYLFAGIAVILVTIIACEKSAISVDELQTIQQEELSVKGDKAQAKVDICHWTGKKWVSISVAEASLDAHWAHGDKYAFSPVGSYSFLYSGLYSHDYVIDFFDGVNFSGTGGYPSGGPYTYTEVFSGTVVDGILTGSTDYNESSYSLDITGTVDECGGNMSFDNGWEPYTPE